MRIEKRIGAALTASALAFGLIATPLESVPLSLGAAVSAQEQLVSAYISADMSSLPDNKELEEAYINSLFYGGGFSFYKDYGRDQLSGTQLEVYNALRSKIKAVANGSAESTVFTLTRTVSVESNDEAQAELNKFGKEIQTAVQYLLVDLPADFYWYDKSPTGGMHGGGGSSGTFANCTLTYTLTFTVADDYAGQDKTTVNSSKITAAKKSAETAQAIAAEHNDKTDYEKVLAFRDEICNLTDYNHPAADNSSTPYGDPWQLVWVFDDDPDTLVVCEGYSKAFQYLCDLSNVECYTVTGTMAGGTGAGRHMWNIVVLDGESYLVDITNCDDGTAGNPDKLLLKGASESTADGCKFTNPNLTYVYDKNSIFPADILTVSTKDYTPTVHEHEWDEENWKKDETGHWHACKDTTCKEKKDFAAHTPGAAATEENPQLCTICQYEIAPKLDHEHDWSEEWKSDETGHWHACKDTTCKEKNDFAAHTPGEPTQENVENATCTTAGSYDEVVRCKVCDEIISSTHKDGEKLPHDMEEVPGTAKAPTCVDEGKEADKKCQNCVYTEEGEVLAATGKHTMAEVPNSAEEATCGKAGKEADKECSVCGLKETGKEIPATGEHKMTEVEGSAKEVTCAEAGKEADKECSVCGLKETGKEIPATGEHKMTEVEGSAKEATCAEAGKEADKECSVCGLKETGKEIPATGNHTEGEPVRENEVAATCTKEGSYDEVIECTVCGKELSRESKIIEKLSHTPGTPEKENEVSATCTKDGSYDMVTRCEVCEEVTDTEHTVVPATGHNFGSVVQGETTHYQECSKCGTKVGEAAHTKDSGTVTTKPTEETDGVRTYSCTVCGKELETEVIPALGTDHEHSYTIKNSNTSSHWNECVCGEKDLDSVAAHTEAEKEEIALEAVCNVDGLKYVITYCTDCDREISRDSVVIPKTGVHNPSTDYGKDSTDHWNTCTDCGSVVNKEPHTAGPAATETTPQTCTVCGYEMAPVIAHTHTFASAWTSDDSFHWHAATCQHTDEVSGKAAHVWDGGIVTTQPTETSKGVKTFTCTVCAATKTEPVSELAHTHTPSDAWSSDITGHWHVCGSCDEKLNFAAHNEVSEITKAPTATVPGTRRYYCSVCRYVIREEDIPATGVVDPVYPSYPTGSTIVFPPTANTKDPILDNGSGKSGWKSIADDIRNASSGDAVYVNMNGTTTLSKTALKELMGKNVDLVLDMGGDITWTVNGETVTKASDVNMKAKLNTNNIPNKIIEALSENGEVVQVSLSHSGNFGFDAVMTVYLGTRYNGKYANLMYYNSKSGAAEYVDCSLITNGKAALDFTHASEYAIVISDKPMGEYEDVSAAAEAYESGINVSAAVYVSVLAVIAAAMVIFRKKAAK